MDEVKKKVYLDVFASPGTILPVAGGLTALIASWAMGGNPAMNFAGVAGVVTGIGVLATRIILGLDRITERAYDHVVHRQQREQERALEHLHKRLLNDNDPRTHTCLTELRHLYSRLKEKVDAGKVNASSYDVIQGVDDLFQTCVTQLEHSVDLWETASTMMGPARNDMLRQRDELVDEICETVVHLGRTVDKFHAVTTNKNRKELARLRKELDRSMDVAREVERRTDQLIEEKRYSPRDFEQ